MGVGEPGAKGNAWVPEAWEAASQRPGYKAPRELNKQIDYYSLLKDIRIKNIPYSCLLKGVWVEMTKYSLNID